MGLVSITASCISSSSISAISPPVTTPKGGHLLVVFVVMVRVVMLDSERLGLGSLLGTHRLLVESKMLGILKLGVEPEGNKTNKMKQ